MYLKMEQLADINFLAAIEGQEIERTLKKIVSISDVQDHIRTLNNSDPKRARTRMLILAFFMAGFYQVQLYTPGGVGYHRACTKMTGKRICSC